MGLGEKIKVTPNDCIITNHQYSFAYIKWFIDLLNKYKLEGHNPILKCFDKVKNIDYICNI